MRSIKKLILIIIILIPIAVRSFVVNNNNFFLDEEETISKFQINLVDRNITLELEEYIIGVVAAEMPALFEKEALKAQAIAARSFALSGAINYEVFITSTTNDQVFITEEEMKAKWGNDFDIHFNRISEAVRATENKVIKRDGQILRAYYFSMSNGFTKDSIKVWGYNIFYGTEVKWDNEELRNFNYTREFTTLELVNALEKTQGFIELGDINRHQTNHVATIKVNNQEFSGIDFRHRLGIRSTDFDIKRNDTNFIITTRGFGHGVGMSQHGANGMAREGYNYSQILKHFYNDIEIVNI